MVAADPRLGGGMKIPDRLYARSLEDVRIYFASLHSASSFENSKLTLTLLVDYRPVDVVFEHLSEDRNRVIERSVGSGAQFPIDEDVEIVDITLPAEEIARDGVHDLGIAYRFETPIEEYASAYPIRLFRAGYERPLHPCFPMGKIGSTLEAVKKIVSSDGPFDAFVYPSSGFAKYEDLHSLKASPGESVEIRWVLEGFRTDYHMPMVLVPLLNGKALDWREFVIAHSVDVGIAPTTAKGTLDLELPHKPGVYELHLGTWTSPFLLPDDRPGRGIRMRDHNRYGSNVLEFHVE